MPAQPEGRLQLRIQKALKVKYGRRIFLFKVHGSALMLTGLPDLIGCIDGRFFGLEVKMPKGVVSERQTYVHSLIRAAGGVIDVPRSVTDALESIERMISSSDVD